MGEIVYCGEKIKSNASSKHNLADISEPLYPNVATKRYIEKQLLHLFIKKKVSFSCLIFIIFAEHCTKELLK